MALFGTNLTDEVYFHGMLSLVTVLGREQGKWYPAVPPLSRPNAGMSPADYFGRTLVAEAT